MVPAAETDQTDWYILRGREQSGPHPLSLLRNAATGGRLSEFDLVWKPGWDDWRDAGSVHGLFDPPEIAPEMPSGGPPPTPTDAPPVQAETSSASPAPVPAPPPPPSRPTPSSSNYLMRHWRGEHSLPMTFWVNAILVGGLAGGLIAKATDWFVDADESFQSYQVVIVLVANVALLLAVNAWQFVGIWRSASRHKSRGGWAPWAWAAKFIVVVEAVAATIVTGYFDVPRIAGNVRLALEDHDTGGHTFRLLRDGTELEFSGGITLGTARDFALFLEASPHVKVLHLHSGGGRMVDGHDIAEQVWKRGLETYVSVQCSSTCALIFLAGRKRWLGEHARLGFHQPHAVGATDEELRLGIQYEREYLASRGVPTDFAEKALSTPSSSIWFPTHDELMSANVITGLAEKGRFAESGESADLANVLLQVPIYASLKKAHPKLFEDFANAVLQERQDGDGTKEGLSSAAALFGDVVDHLLPHATDPLVLERTSIYLGYMDTLRSVDPESCAALGGGNDAQLKADLSKQFPELWERETAFRKSLIVSTDPDRPSPTESEVDPLLTQVLAKARERFGDDANLLSKDTLDPAEYRRFCEVTIGLYQEVMRLPPAKAADVMRYLYDEL
jgi:hypothetical protein